MSTATVTPEIATKPVTRLRDLKESARDQLMIDPRIIVVDHGHNPRDYSLPENRAHLDSLKASIRELGTLQPLWVRYDAGRKAAVLVDGECRLRANLELIAEGVEITAVPTIQVAGGNEADRLVLALTANTGKNLSQWEMGSALRKLQTLSGWSIEQIAAKLGKTVRYINDALDLSDSPQDVKVMLSESTVTPALALAHVRKNGDKAGESLKQAVKVATEQGRKVATRAKAESKADKSLAAAEQLAAAIEKHLQAGSVYIPASIIDALKAYRNAR